MLDETFDQAMAPKELSDLVGRNSLLGENSLLGRSSREKYPLSLVIYGPPGSGKTTLAKLYAAQFESSFYSFSAAKDTLSDIKVAMKKIEAYPLLESAPIFFIDEFHRLGKVGQDFFLSFVEKRKITLLTATTENPSFVINPAILSRLQTLTLPPFTEKDFQNIIDRFLSSFPSFSFEDKAIDILKNEAKGDCRWLLWQLKTIYHLKIETLDLETLASLNFKKRSYYDKNGEHHYNHLSALQKSIRTSDPDASLYYLARMIQHGEDPMVIFRRLIRISIEDIGLADPGALKVALNARDAFTHLGIGEGELSLAYVTIFLALSPKSSSALVAWNLAKTDTSTTTDVPPPPHLISKQGGKSTYIYDHSTAEGCSGQDAFPESVGRKTFYTPVLRGFERALAERLEYFSKIRADHSAKKNLQHAKK